MLSRGGKGPSGHQPRQPSSSSASSSSSRFYFNQQTGLTRINNYNGPANLPVYQWKQDIIPLHQPSPLNVNGRKRQRNSHSSQLLAKRQRVESYEKDEVFPSFEPPPPPPPHQNIAGMSLSSPPAHRAEPGSPVTLNGLQSYAKDKVSSQMVELFEGCQQQQSDLYQKEMYRAQLQRDIQRVYPDARLYLTGSSMSGLGCRSSDADLCLVLSGRNKKWEAISTLTTLLRFFRALAYVDRILLIRATVPILRFRKTGSNLEFDLNVNNTVGIRNTFLLRSYTHADIRIRPFMLVIKKWARHCEINDASKGTLSSYTLALMALNYLQSVKPPVLPSLQRDHPACFDPSLELDLVPDGSQRVPHYKSKNKASLSELFLGFLEYYSSKFRWDSQIISVRAATTFPMMNSPEWRNKFICVEEPFEKRNVARAVHKKEQFDAIKAKFAESYKILREKKDLTSLLPLGAIVHKEQSVR